MHMVQDLFRINRRTVLGGMAASAVTGITGAWAAIPALPASPVVITVMDVGGALALMQPAFEVSISS
jgi:putative spermidine/putrescine transport system substrate-binding protein